MLVVMLFVPCDARDVIIMVKVTSYAMLGER